MKRAWTGLLIVLVLAVALVAFLATHEFDSPVLGQALLEKMSAATGVDIKARAFRLKILSGFVLEGVEATSNNADRSLHLTLDRLVFEHRLAPLLSGVIAVDKVLLENPRIEVIEAATPTSDRAPADRRRAPEARPGHTTPPPATAPASIAEPAAGSRLSLELGELIVRNSEVTFRRAGETRGARLEGLTLTMNDVIVDPTGRSLASLTGRGTMTVTAGTLDTLTFRDAKSQFQLAQSRFEMPELSFTSPYGQVSGETQVDFNRSPFAYRIKARADGVDLNRILASPGGLGAASVELTADGAGATSKDINAKGVVSLAAGKLPGIPALRGIDKVLSKTVLVDWPYKATSAPFTLNDDVLTLAPFRFETELARVDMRGTAALAGNLNLGISVATPADGIRIDGVGSRVLQVLSDSSGWVALPLQLSGTLEQPRIRPDVSALSAQTKQGLLREAREEVQAQAERAKQRAMERATDAIRRAVPRIPR